jgi:flagellar protein FliO/FliZ
MISQGLTSLLWFALILALIPLALWLLKRTPMGGAAAHGILRSVAALPLSASQRIVTVEVGQGAARRWLVLGVTPHSITTLHAMEPQADAAPFLPPGGDRSAPAMPPPGSTLPPARSALGFAELYAKLRTPKGSVDAR